MAGRWEPKLIGDYEWDEVVSSLQKMIRAGKEYEACWWCYVLHQSGYGLYLWRRLEIISSEDVAGGNDMAAVVVASLRENWLDIHKQVKEPILDKLLFCCQAAIYLCRSKKSREIDSLVNLLDERWKAGERLEIEEIALDPHCLRGRKLNGRFGANDGRENERLDKWFSLWGKVTNEAYPDKWQPELEQIWRDKAKAMKNTAPQQVSHQRVVDQ